MARTPPSRARAMTLLPEWRPAELPHPPAYNLVNALRVIGPGAILLGLSLGSGDWLLGPVVVTRHGPALLWICTASVLLQAALNAEMARYTLATGEPIWAGFLRTPPGPGFWAWVYSGLHLFQLGWPGWALAAGTTAAALFLGRSPRDQDHVVVLALGYLLFAAAVGAVLLGRRGQDLLWHADRIFLVGTLLFLAILAVVLVPPPVWRAVAAGFLGPFVGMPRPPGDLDWPLLTAFAAYSGAGGVVNASLTHWMRDKGFGVAGIGRGTPVQIADHRLHLVSEGLRLEPSEGNLAKWREWWRYLGLHLGILWVLGPMAAMALPVLLTAHLVPFGSNMQSGAAALALARALGADGTLWLWFPTLLAGLWIFFLTQRGVAEGFVRSVTEILWTGSDRARAWAGERPSRLYHAVLGVFAVAGGAALALGDPLKLVLIGANVGALGFVMLSVHTLWANRRLLPRALRPSLWREALVVACGLFFAALVARVLARPLDVLALLR
jgi:hypothetical protein